MLHRSSVMFFTWLPVPLRAEFKICFLVYKLLHGVAPACHGYLRNYCKETLSSTSGLRLRSMDKCDLLVRRMKTLVTAPSQLLAPDAGTNFLLLCVQPIQSIHLKLDLRPTYSATHIPLLVDCKAPF